MTVFHPKLIILESENVTMQIFKEMVAETLYGAKGGHGGSYTIPSTHQ